MLRGCLIELRNRPVNFSDEWETLTAKRGWTLDGAHGVFGREAAGPPEEDGPFARARQALIEYDFSDPRIVVGHFDPRVPLLGRDMLLELKVLGVLRFLGGVRVRLVEDRSNAVETVFGFRYDTLQGHIERGAEWFRIRKDHDTGELTMAIEARWRRGTFPTWWSELGFLLLGNVFRRVWRRLALIRLRRLAAQPATVQPVPPGELVHRGSARPRRTRTRSQNQ